MVGSDFKPFSSFPSAHVPPGWLRSMLIMFFLQVGQYDFVPDMEHGLALQRLVRKASEQLGIFRDSIREI